MFLNWKTELSLGSDLIKKTQTVAVDNDYNDFHLFPL